ncbi:MAG: archaeosortase/exosortase family protein, partial [Burkholderiaceae bacterium]
LSIGQYQLLVADACSGLNSIFSLSAMGLLYLYLMRHRSMLRDTLLVLSIVPIAIFANLLRVLFLVLLTFHFGDGAGQGFLHGFAGMFLFAVALLMLFGFDRLLGRVSALSPGGAS